MYKCANATKINGVDFFKGMSEGNLGIPGPINQHGCPDNIINWYKTPKAAIQANIAIISHGENIVVLDAVFTLFHAIQKDPAILRLDRRVPLTSQKRLPGRK